MRCAISRSLRIGVLALLASCCCLTGSAQFLFPTNPVPRVQLGWNPVLQDIVAGYRLYWGAGSRQYTNLAEIAGRDTGTAWITNLAWSATYYFAATSYTTNGLESDFSNEAVWLSPSLPPAPSNLSATNAAIKVAVEISPSPSGPWAPYSTLFTTTSTPGFYRSVVSISPAKVASPRKLLLSPKHQAR